MKYLYFSYFVYVVLLIKEETRGVHDLGWRDTAKAFFLYAVIALLHPLWLPVVTYVYVKKLFRYLRRLNPGASRLREIF